MWLLGICRIATPSLQSLAAFRIGLSTAVLIELARSWPVRCDMYSDEGILSLADPLPWPLSPILHRGGCKRTTVVFVVHTLVAIALLVGWHSRLSAAAAYVLHLSLLHRNRFCHVSDTRVLCASLLWSALLPNIGATWSLDSRVRSAPARSTPHVAALGLKVHLVVFYSTAAIIKVLEGRYPPVGSTNTARGSSPWVDGTAIAEALTCCEYQRPLGAWLLGWPDLCVGLTWLVLALEAFAPLMLLVLDSLERLAVLLLLFGTRRHRPHRAGASRTGLSGRPADAIVPTAERRHRVRAWQGCTLACT